MRNILGKLRGRGAFIIRAIHTTREEGLSSALRRVRERATKAAYLDEAHFWYELALLEERPRLDLPGELALKRRNEDDLSLLETMPMMQSMEEARSRLAAGHELWIAAEGEQAAFACWIFHDSMPVVAAPKGYVLTPPEIVCLEGSVASPLYRGRNIAGAVVSKVADEMQRTGVRYMVTKIETGNIPSQRFVMKIGFRKIGLVRYRKRMLRQTTAASTGECETSGWLAEQITR